nr:probable protein phosphatase 2C 75 [Ipomoea batatas]
MHHSSSPAITHVTTAPVVGAMSISRSSHEMEDALCVRPNFCSLEINRHHPLHHFAVFEGHGHAHIDKNTESKMAPMAMAKLIAASQKRVQLLGAAAFFNPLPPRPSKSVIRQAAPNLSIFEREGHHWTHCRHIPVKCKL